VTSRGPQIVGRSAELEQIERFLLRVDQGPATLLIEGEAGLGKTTLWNHAVELAREQGVEVLLARPIETESGFAFAALADLIGNHLEDVGATLPPPQRRALRAALFIEDAAEPVEEQLACAAFLTALRQLAAERPVAVAVDDVQWLDRSSAAALKFAWRRLGDESISFLIALRTGSETAIVDTAPRLERLALPPLSIGSLQRLIHDRSHMTMPRRVLRRIAEVSGGNPFFAIELANAIARRGGRLPVDGEVPIPDDLRELLTERLRAFPADTFDILVATAVASEPPLQLLEHLVGVAWKRLLPTIDEGVLKLDGNRIRFTHPLLAAAVMSRSDPQRRRELHRMLAYTVTDPEDRARHLANAITDPDADIARELEVAAARARARGAPEAASNLFRRSAALTPPGAADVAARRIVAAAVALDEAGDGGTAQGMLRELLETLPSAPERAEALTALGTMAEDPSPLREALREAAGDARLRARALLGLFEWIDVSDGPAAAVPLAEEAIELARSAGDDATHAIGTAMLGHASALLGRDDALEILERARAIEGERRLVSRWRAPDHWIGVTLMWRDDPEGARLLLTRSLRDALDYGDETSANGLCFHLAQLETRAGRAQSALEFGRTAHDLTRATNRPQSIAIGAYALGLAESWFGDVATGEELVRQALAVFEARDDRFFTIHARSALGAAAISRNDTSAAAAALEGVRELRRRLGVREPGIFPFDADEIEAMVGCGKLDEAEALAAGLLAEGRGFGRPRMLATGFRSLALIRTAQGELDEAGAALAEALVWHERLPAPLEHARTMLSLGRVERRRRRRGEARAILTEAIGVFARCGAHTWRARAEDELARIGGRTPSGRELTEAERRVADLVAAGHTNKEVAASLYLSVHTVEKTLTRVYTKLGVRSRTELSRRLTAG